MSKELRELLEEFHMHLEVKTEQKILQARELKSLQRAIFEVADKEWNQLSEEEQKAVRDIIDDTESWWYTEVV